MYIVFLQNTSCIRKPPGHFKREQGGVGGGCAHPAPPPPQIRPCLTWFFIKQRKEEDIIKMCEKTIFPIRTASTNYIEFYVTDEENYFMRGFTRGFFLVTRSLDNYGIK